MKINKMKRIIRNILSGALLMTAGVASAQTIVADKIVAVVGNSAILYSEVVDMSKRVSQEYRERGQTQQRDAMSEALENLMLQKLLYNQAIVDSVDIHNRGQIAEQVSMMVEQLVKEKGSVPAVEAFFHKPIYSISEDMQTQYEEGSYAMSMRQELQGKVRITPGEVERFYKRIPKDSLPIIPEQYVYAQITKFPTSTTEAKQRVKERMLELRERIIGGTRFEVLARMYSVDPGSAVRGGEMDPMPKEGFVKPFGDALGRLRPGQISEVVETEFGFHIIQLIDKDGNLYRARHILMRPLFSDEELGSTAASLDSLALEIREGNVTFAEAALRNSDDPYSRLNGGIVSNHELIELYDAGAKMSNTKFFREDLPREDYMALKELKPGEVSAAYQAQDMRGNQMARVVKLIEIIPSHTATLKEDYLRLEEMALDDKAEAEFDKWLKKKIDAMYIRIDPEFRKPENFENKAWIK